jgi:ATP-binding cassette, subfamily B, bacterial
MGAAPKTVMFRSAIQYIKQTWHDITTQGHYIPKALRMVWDAAHWYVATWFTLTIIAGLLPPLSIGLTRRLVDEVVAEIAAQAFDPAMLFKLGLPLILLMFLQLVFGTIRGWISLIQSDLISDHVSALIQKKAISLDISYFEVPEYYNKLHLASTDARTRPLQILQSISALITQSINLMATTIILASFSSWIVPLLFLSTLPILAVTLRQNRIYLNFLRKNVPDQRRASYYDALLTDRDAAAEVRTLNIGELYHQKYLTIRKRIREERLSLEQRRTLNNLGTQLISTLTGFAVLAWMVFSVFQGSSGLGDLVAFYQALQQSQGAVKGLQGQFSTTIDSMLSLHNLFSFLSLETRLRDDPKVSMVSLPLQKGIRFENVTFYYPESSRPALQNFSWTLPAGKIIALIGMNGAGKSTLIKLLCRLYDVTEGRVVWDDEDVRDLPLQDIRNAVNVLFQEPYRYYETAGQMIAMGDPALQPDHEKLTKVAALSGADDVINQLANGMATMLGKRFGGDELSAGQWQRLALARAFYHERPILILDEPTSSIDSWIENLWIQRLRQFGTNKTVLVVTHRLSTAQLADTIAVLHNNTIAEEGTHDELIERKGLYATAWDTHINSEQAVP